MSRILLPQGFRFPLDSYVAVSGGVDSMALLSFLLNGRRNVKVVHYNHRTPNADKYQAFVESFCSARGIPVILGTLPELPPAGASKEHWWGYHRHQFFGGLDAPVLLAHHLDDALETWMMSTAKGTPKLPSWVTQDGRCIRPLLLNSKETLASWCLNKGIPWVEDSSNQDVSVPRNRIRHKVIPEMLQAYPGIYSTIRNKLRETYKT